MSTERPRRPEHSLLLGAARWALEGDATVDVPGGVDWKYVGRQAKDHSMAAPVYRWLSTRPDLDVPPAVLDPLEAEARRATYGALDMASTLHRVLDVFDAHGVRALPYKGPTLRAAVHDDVAFREAADIDVLLPRADVPTARAALVEAGFTPRVDLTDRELRTHLRGGRHTALVSESDVIVELHWRATIGHFPFPVDFEALWADRTSVEVAGEQLPAIPPEELLLLLAVHGNRHCWRGLCWLCDFAAAVGTFDVDWDRLLARAADRGGERMVRVGVELADRLLGVDQPAAVRERPSDDAVDDLATRVEERFLWEASLDTLPALRYKFAVRERRRDRVRMAARLAALPNRNDIDVLPRPLRYYPLAVLARPFRVSAKAAGLLLERTDRGRPDG